MRDSIRLVQYGVGPIGANMVKLALQKQGLEIVGAIDVDPAKSARILEKLPV